MVGTSGRAVRQFVIVATRADEVNAKTSEEIKEILRKEMYTRILVYCKAVYADALFRVLMTNSSSSAETEASREQSALDLLNTPVLRVTGDRNISELHAYLSKFIQYKNKTD